MENKVKGTRFDVRNNRWDCRYCSDGDQYHRHYHQYRTYRQKRFLNIKKATAKLPPVGCFFDKTI